jgi:chaperone modulatory protein CbpM
MDIEHSELIWLDEKHEVTLDELVEISGMPLEELTVLVESGALIPNNLDASINAEAWHFNCQCIDTIRTLSRLKQAFELEQNSLGLMMVFLERIQKLEYKLSELNHFKQ